jgi:hypothetical protein
VSKIRCVITLTRAHGETRPRNIGGLWRNSVQDAIEYVRSSSFRNPSVVYELSFPGGESLDISLQNGVERWSHSIIVP